MVLVNKRFVGLVCSVMNVEIAVAIERRSATISIGIIGDVSTDVIHVDVVPSQSLEVLAVNTVTIKAVIADEFVFLRRNCTCFAFTIF